MNQVLQLDLSRKLAPIYAKSVINIFYLIIVNSKISFDVIAAKKKSLETKRVDNSREALCLGHPQFQMAIALYITARST